MSVGPTIPDQAWDAVTEACGTYTVKSIAQAAVEAATCGPVKIEGWAA